MSDRLRAVRPTGPALVALVLALLALAALAGHGSLAPLHPAPYRPVHTIHMNGGPPLAVPRGGSRSSPLPAWIGDVLLGLLGVVLAVVLGWALVWFVSAARDARAARISEERVSARTRVAVAGPEPPEQEPATALRDALDRSLEEVQTDPNARRAIIGAYRLMEIALARAGLERGPAEGPREYLARALDALSVGPDAPRRLTALFERARYDDRALGLELRDEAVEALLGVRSEL